MTIIAPTYTQFCKALVAAGVMDFGLIQWIKQPMRINGMWRAEIKL